MFALLPASTLQLLKSRFKLSTISRALLAVSTLIPLQAMHAAQAATVQPSAAAQPATQQPVLHSYHFHLDHVLGTSLDMVAMAPSQAVADRALQAVQTEIARLDSILSTWRHDSEISQLNQRHDMVVSDDLFQVIQLAEQWRGMTNNAFSPRLGALVAQWQQGGMQQQTPDAKTLQQLAVQAGQADVQLDAATRRIVRPQGVQFAVDAVAKGYIIDAAMQAASRAEPSVKGLMLDIGGDLRCVGTAPRSSGWNIGVHAGESADNSLVQQILCINNQAVAHSGSGARDMQVGDTAYAHTLSPQDGQSISLVRNSTVVASTAAMADLLATALSVMSPDDAMALVNRLPAVEARLTTASGEQRASNGWQALLAATQAPRLMTVASGNTALSENAWPSDFAVNIDFDIPKIDSNQYRAPYVSVWVTDENRNLVKHLLLLGKDEKWVNSNFVWWKRYGRRLSTQELDSKAKPSRKPGHYQVVWDGLDEQGKKVPQGKYILHYEATREFGGHDYASLDIELGSKGFDDTINAKGELGNLKLRFGKKAY